MAYGFLPAVLGGGLTALGGAGDSATAVSAVVAVALGTVAAYVLPAAVARVAETGRLGDGFAFGAVGRAVTTRTYATAWLVGAGSSSARA